MTGPERERGVGRPRRTSSPRHEEGPDGPDGRRFDRLRATSTFAGDAHERWRSANLAIVGLGVLGSLFSREASRSGARLDLYDFDVGEEHNRGNQPVEVGQPKADAVARLCNAIAPGSARAYVTDIRHVGAGAFESLSLIVDCSDDPALALPLTQLSNGWGVPLLRLAVDGSGSRELGRVLASHGGGGRACQICGSGWKEVFDPGPRRPCYDADTERPPTNAGSALAMSVAGLGLLQAQRLVGGNGADEVLDKEVFVDLDTPGIFPMRLRRSKECLSGHESFAPTRLGRAASETTVGELFELAHGVLAHPSLDEISLAFRGHPILLGAACRGCGVELVHPGTPWREGPDCPSCGGVMERRRDVALDRLNPSQARALGLPDTSCATLGLPASGGLVAARAPGREPIQLLFSREGA